MTKAFSFLLARFIAWGIKEPIVSLLSIKSGKIFADIAASLLIFLFTDNWVEKIKAYFLWERVKYMQDKIIDLDAFLLKNVPDLYAELQQDE